MKEKQKKTKQQKIENKRMKHTKQKNCICKYDILQCANILTFVYKESTVHNMKIFTQDKQGKALRVHVKRKKQKHNKKKNDKRRKSRQKTQKKIWKIMKANLALINVAHKSDTVYVFS